MSVYVMPSGLPAHWYDKGAAPAALTLNVAALPTTTLWSAGWVRTVGTLSGGGGASALPPQAASRTPMAASATRWIAARKQREESGRSRVWRAFMSGSISKRVVHRDTEHL